MKEPRFARAAEIFDRIDEEAAAIKRHGCIDSSSEMGTLIEKLAPGFLDHINTLRHVSAEKFDVLDAYIVNSGRDDQSVLIKFCTSNPPPSSNGDFQAQIFRGKINIGDPSLKNFVDFTGEDRVGKACDHLLGEAYKRHLVSRPNFGVSLPLFGTFPRKRHG